MPDYKQIQDIARASLMADFFAVRIDEEGLYGDLQTLLASIKLPTPYPPLERLRVAAAAPDAAAFMEAVKGANMFEPMRELLVKIKLG